MYSDVCFPSESTLPSLLADLTLGRLNHREHRSTDMKCKPCPPSVFYNHQIKHYAFSHFLQKPDYKQTNASSQTLCRQPRSPCISPLSHSHQYQLFDRIGPRDSLKMVNSVVINSDWSPLRHHVEYFSCLTPGSHRVSHATIALLPKGRITTLNVQARLRGHVRLTHQPATLPASPLVCAAMCSAYRSEALQAF